MLSDAITFVNSSLIGSTVTASFTFTGGRAVAAVSATQFGTSVQLQYQTLNQLWVPIASAFVASQLFTFDAPAGSYRIAQAGSSVGIAASLCKIST